jgi:hypothetical protein
VRIDAEDVEAGLRAGSVDPAAGHAGFERQCGAVSHVDDDLVHHVAADAVIEDDVVADVFAALSGDAPHDTRDRAVEDVARRVRDAHLERQDAVAGGVDAAVEAALGRKQRIDVRVTDDAAAGGRAYAGAVEHGLRAK